MHKQKIETARGLTATHSGAIAQGNGIAHEGAGLVAGVDIGGTHLRLALADLSGNIRSRSSTTTAGIRDPDAVIGMICDGVRSMLDEAGATAASLRAIAVGAPGVTNVDEGIVIATSYLLGWRDVPLRARLEEELGVPAAIDNDVNLAAIGEGWRGVAGGEQDFVFLAMGTGLGAGIVLNGRPYRGRGWLAGEIGYMLLPGTADRPAKRNEPGTLEALIGGEGIQAQWREMWSAQETPLPRDLVATEIFDHALNGDALARTILERTATMLAQAIYNVSLVLDCPLFVLGGGVGKHPALKAATEEVLARGDARVRPRVMASALGAEAQLQGAIRAALDAAGVDVAAAR